MLIGQTGQQLPSILKKGKQVYVEGSPEVEAYTNKDNQPAATLRVRVREFNYWEEMLMVARAIRMLPVSHRLQFKFKFRFQHRIVIRLVSYRRMEEAADDLPF